MRFEQYLKTNYIRTYLYFLTSDSLASVQPNTILTSLGTLQLSIIY